MPFREKKFAPYNPTSSEEDALGYFRKRLGQMRDTRRPFLDRWLANEDLFKGHLDVASKADWQSHLFIPRTYGLVMAELSQLAVNKPDLFLDPENRGDALRIPYMKAVAMENWRKNRGPSEFLFAFLDAIKLGTAFFEIGYRAYEREIKEVTDFDPATGKIQWEKSNTIEFDDVFFEAVRPYDMYIDENAAWMSEAMDAARRQVFRWEVFMHQYADKYPKASAVMPGPQFDDTDEDVKWKPFEIDRLEFDAYTETVEVIRYYNKVDDTMWIVANGVLLNNPDDPIPFHHKQLPFAELKPAPWDKYTFYGVGVPELIEPLQDELNTMRNMMQDQAHLNVFSPFLFSGDEDINEDLMRIEPGVGIPVEDPSNYQFIKQAPIGADAYRSIELIDADMRQATGIDPRFQGLASGGTATETAFLKETTLQRINLHLQFLERASMPRFAELWGDTLQQFFFKSTKTQKKIGGKEGEEIMRTVRVDKADLGDLNGTEEKGGFFFLEVTPEKIRGTYDWNLLIGTSVGISKELSKQLTLRFYAMLSQDPLADKERLLRDVLESHDKDPEEYMVTIHQADKMASVWLAEEQNKQLIAGQQPEIITSMITPEHIAVHQAAVESDALNKRPELKRAIMQHTIEEVRAQKTQKISAAIAKAEGAQAIQGQLAGQGQGADQPTSTADQVPGIERLPNLTKRLSSTPGLPREATEPGAASKLGAEQL